jgi:hypothetical protein
MERLKQFEIRCFSCLIFLVNEYVSATHPWHIHTHTHTHTYTPLVHTLAQRQHTMHTHTHAHANTRTPTHTASTVVHAHSIHTTHMHTHVHANANEHTPHTHTHTAHLCGVVVWIRRWIASKIESYLAKSAQIIPHPYSPPLPLSKNVFAPGRAPKIYQKLPLTNFRLFPEWFRTWSARTLPKTALLQSGPISWFSKKNFKIFSFFWPKNF